VIAARAAEYGTLSFDDGVAETTATAFKSGPGQSVTASDSGKTGSSDPFSVANDGTLGGITIDPVGSQTAGTAFSVTINAFDSYGNALPQTSGGALTGLATSPGCSTCHPSFAGTAPNHGSPASWTGNAGTISGVIATDADPAATITATLGSKSNSATFAVGFKDQLYDFSISAIGATQTAGTAIASFTITAVDQYGNLKGNQSSGTLSGLATSPGCTLCDPGLPATAPVYGTVSWNSGVGTASGVTPYNAQAGAAVTMTDGSVSETSNTFIVNHAAALGDFSVSTIATPQTAGTAFGFSVTAYDPYGNVKKDNTAGTLSGLATSPGCDAPFCTPAVAGTAPIYGSTSWANGVGTVTGVKAFNAQPGAAITITAGTVAETSNAFTVNPIGANKLFFAYTGFDGQPIDTKITFKVYHVCTPSGTTGDPCASSSAKVQVLALDVYGNRAAATTVTVKVNGGGSSYTGVTSNGIASIATPTAPVAPSISGGFNLVATAPGSSNATSRTVQAVNDLEACEGNACDNLATNQATQKQKAFGEVQPGEAPSGAFQAAAAPAFGGDNPVTLQTQFLPFDNGRCSNPTSKSVGQTTEIKVTGAGVSATSPDFSLVLVYPKDTIKAAGYTARNADAFNICLGATWLGASPVTPWRAKTSLTNSTLTAALPDGNGVYWGWVPNCSQLTATERETNPCISLRTKQAATLRAAVVPSVMSASDFTALGMKDADVAIVISKPFPWDGKLGLK
jgi:hypothetical protein